MKLKFRKLQKSSSLPNLVENNANTTLSCFQYNSPKQNELSFYSTGFTFRSKAKKGDHETQKENVNFGDFFFLFGENPELVESNNESMQRCKDTIRKLGQWDKDHLSSSDERKKSHLTKEDFLYSDNQGISQNSLLKSFSTLAKFHKKEVKEVRKNAHYITKSSFNFNVFMQDNADSENKKNDNLVNSEVDKELYLKELVKEKMKTELKHRDKLMAVYQIIIKKKIKKKRYDNLLDEAYHLLDQARTEYLLCTDILKERIKRVQKYYEAFLETNRGFQIEKKAEEPKKNEEENTNETNYQQLENNSGGSQTSRARRVRKGIIINNENFSMDSESDDSKKRKKKTLLDIYEEKIKKYREYNGIIEDINKEINAYDIKFNDIREELTKIIDENKEKMNKIYSEMIDYKIMFQDLCKDQRVYYLEILKEGKDTRNEGLSWVVKRLLELNIPLENTIFPNYLDSEQIEYLINISKLKFESSQLKLILKTLKSRQQSVINSDKKRKMEKITYYSLAANNKSASSLIKRQFDSKAFSKKNKERLEHLYSKYMTLTKSKIEKKIEETEIMAIVKTIKKKLCQCSVMKNFEFIKVRESNVMNFFLGHEREKEYFQDILTLRERIKEIDNFVIKMVKEEFKIFTEKYKFMKKKQNKKASVYYDKIYSALFGTSVFIV